MILVGWLTVFFGALWTIFPKTLRWWLVGKASWFLYWLFLAYLYVPISTFVAPYGLKGWIGLAVGLIVFGGLLRSVIAGVAAKAPLLAFRAIGALNLAAGIYLVFLKAKL